MKRIIVILALLTFCGLADGRPKIIEETQWLRSPDPSLTFFAESVAIDGDWALATALHSADGTYNYPYQQLALLYRRMGDTWAFDRILVEDDADEASWNHPSVAMKNGLASVSLSPLRTFRLADGDWSETPRPFPAPVGDAGWANGLTRIDGATVAAITNRCFHGAGTTEFVAGGWTPPQLVTGNARNCGLANHSASLDIAGDTLVLTNPQEDAVYPPAQLQIYGRSAPRAPWQLTDTLPVGEFGRGVALLGDDLVVGDFHRRGNLLFRRGAEGWTQVGHLPTLKGFSRFYDGAYHIARSGDLVLFSAPLFDDLRGSIAVYRRAASGRYEHVALLVSRNGDLLGDVVDISGRSVVVSGRSREAADDGRLYFFELPEDFSVPAVRQDDFEDGNAAGWQPTEGQFTIARRGTSRVLRQTELSGSGSAVLTGSDTTSQSISVDIHPMEFSGTDRWVGVATRYRDAGNHYYVTLRSSGRVQLRRLRDGEVTTLESRELPVVEDRNYRVQLESVGTRHRVFVNGVLQIEVIDGAFASGRVALLTSWTAADFDNVVVTPGIRLSIYDNDIVNGADCERFVTEPGLRVSGTPQWDCSVYAVPFLRWASRDGVARAALGPVTRDQAVESRMLVEEFALNGTTDKWLGVMTRYADEGNYYYLVLRSSNVVSLRKLVDGEIVELDSAEFTVTPDLWYRLRLEAVGNKLRGYVNDVLRVEATDATHDIGISGLATYRTAARIDYIRVHQP